MTGVSRAAASFPVVIHTLRATMQSEGRIHTQESTTTEKVSDVAECCICYEERISEQTPKLVHRTNKNCDLYKNKQVCHICIPKLERCPVCRENLTTGEMQNSLVDILVEMQQNNLQAQAQENEEENHLAPIAQNPQPFVININIDVQNPNPVREQRYRCSRSETIIVSGTLIIGLTFIGAIGWFFAKALRDYPS